MVDVVFLPKTAFIHALSPGKKNKKEKLHKKKNLNTLIFFYFNFSCVDLTLINWCGVGVVQA